MSKNSKKKSLLWRICKWIFYIIIFFVISSVLTVVIYKYVNPPLTPIMLIRVGEGWYDGKSVGIEKTWKSFDEISPYFLKACIGAEDGKFLTHDGFDWKAIETAKKYNELHKGQKMRGASTITMQTAKNVFLWHGRNYIRKGLEAYFTVLIEAIWGKKRILEVYANIVELGDGIYGIEAASKKYFNKTSKNLTPQEAALTAAILPNPRGWSPVDPTPYLKRRQSFITGRMNSVTLPKK